MKFHETSFTELYEVSSIFIWTSSILLPFQSAKIVTQFVRTRTMPTRTAPIAQKSIVNNRKRDQKKRSNQSAQLRGRTTPYQRTCESVQTIMGLSVVDGFHNSVLKFGAIFWGRRGAVGLNIARKKTYEI